MLEIGSVVDEKYKILNVIGKGGMSVVYLAMNEKANKPWAIKEVIKNDYKDFNVDKKEIEMMKKLKHSHLPSIIDVIEGGNSLLIVMDYVEGRSLDDLFVEHGAQPQDTVIDWAKQLCDVLSYLHSQNPPIIYRDMKPANVMLRPDGNVMLIDFGAAREYKPQNLKDTISLGTRGYAAPEQYREDGQSDARTDIYCLGVMLFQLLTGMNPHELQPIRNIKPELSSGLEAIIAKCTQVNKEDRYQSCAELLYALEHYWELDSAYRKQQKKKLITFLVPAGMSVFFGIGALAFGMLESRTRSSNYDAYLLAAQNSTTKEDEIENFQRAIRLNPSREEGYLELLADGFLDDNLLSVEESEQLRAILIDYGDGNQTNERTFQSNQEGYERFAYEAGIAYYYKFEEKSNKKNAKGYFEIAADSEYLESYQTERAKRLYKISEYYSKVGIVDEAGDASVTYRDYWNDLVALSGGNLVEMDNARTALVMYEELVSQMISRTTEFKNAGVEQQEMLLQLEQIKEHLDSDFSSLDESNRAVLEEEMQVLLEDMKKAERMVESAYRQTGEVES
ncbi:MAG: serine/threonine protein kinase [Lachnospiraceae bacterium]|nr:serine/threonine protein kinase [Lachnospiraceae bacterium]